MPVFSRASSARPRIVVRSTSPYESRTLTVEYDGVTTAAYLRDSQGGTVGYCWVANHKSAPDTLDPARLDAGQVPLMPLTHTKHPAGRKTLDPQVMEVVWFEAGDGVAVMELGEPLCVIPAWSDIDRGMPGYSRDVVGQTPFARSLDEATEGLRPRIDQARAHWKWQHGAGGWPEFQQAALGHLLTRLGPGGSWWSDIGGKRLPRIGVSERPSTAHRPFTVLSTVGMSCQRMPEDPQAAEPGWGGGADPVRIELALATTLPSQRAGTVFRWLGPLPWREVTHLGAGSCLLWDGEADAFPLGAQWDGVILVEDPVALGASSVPDLTGLTFGKSRDGVRWLWVVPVAADECEYARTKGLGALTRRLARFGSDRFVAE